MLLLVALALAAAQPAAVSQVGIDRSAADMTKGDPATFDLAGFRLGMSEAEVEQRLKSRKLKIVRASRVTGFEDQVLGLLRARGERAPIRGDSVLGEVELDDGQGGRILLKLLAWPDAAHVTSIGYLPPRGTSAEEWRRLLADKYGPAADGGGQIGSEGLHATWCGKASCSGAFGAFLMTADVSANGGSITLRQPDGMKRRHASLVEQEAARRETKRAPAL